MKIIKILSLFAATLFSINCFAAENIKMRELVECNPRAGLPNFFAKAENGANIKVGYLGGSITAQNGWRVQSLKLFQKLYPNSKFSEINAAIGGTGSNFGVMRVGKDIIAQKPDMVFVEFAVNDSGGGKEYIQRNMDGIVRQIWNANPNTDICFVYTIVANDVKSMTDGKMKRTSSIMEELADFYQIPSIDFGKAVVDLVKADKLVMKTDDGPLKDVAGESLNTRAAKSKDGKIPFAKDGVHPHANTGHIIYTEAIKRSLPLIKKASDKIAPHKFATKFSPNSYEKVDAIKTVELDSLKSLPRDENGKSPWSQYVYLENGKQITVKFKGTGIALGVRLGPDSGFMECSIDGGKFKKMRNFDPYCSWGRASMSTICADINDGEHTLVIRSSNESFDKKAVLFKHNHADFDKNPNKYAPLRTYLSGFYITGDFISAGCL